MSGHPRPKLPPLPNGEIPRNRKCAKHDRNCEIYLVYLEGASFSEVAGMFAITRQRAHQIIHRLKRLIKGEDSVKR